MPRHDPGSTTVRSFKFRALRAGLSLAGALAPPLAARAAARLFLTPPRHEPPPGEREALVRGEPFEVPLGAGVLRAWRFGDGPPVLLVHGWGGRGGQMASLVPAVVAAGLSAVAFDGPAHGASSGRVASVPHFADAVAAVAARTGARAGLGHSMGAAGLALALIRGLPLEAAVLVAPPRSPDAYVARFSRAMGLGPAAEARLRAQLARRLGIDPAALDLPRMAAGMEAPLLVVHDRDDREVPWADGAAIAAAWKGARLVTTGGLGHRRILRDAPVAHEAAAFLARNLGAGGAPAAVA